MTTETQAKDIEIRVAAAGHLSSVKIDGEDVPGAFKAVVTTEVGKPTVVEVHAWKNGEPFVFKGKVVEVEQGDV